MTVDQVKYVVTKYGPVLYVAGTVMDGGSMMHAHNSTDGDDIFVAQLSLNSGNINWLEQIGTPGD
jgi:hypothetical protein